MSISVETGKQSLIHDKISLPGFRNKQSVSKLSESKSYNTTKPTTLVEHKSRNGPEHLTVTMNDRSLRNILFKNVPQTESLDSLSSLGKTTSTPFFESLIDLRHARNPSLHIVSTLQRNKHRSNVSELNLPVVSMTNLSDNRNMKILNEMPYKDMPVPF